MNVKDINNVFLNPDFVVQLLVLLNQYELIDDISLRNALIKKEWMDGKKTGELTKVFMERAADKYCLSEKAIDAIIYRNSGKKTISFNPMIKENNNKILNELNHQIPGNT